MRSDYKERREGAAGRAKYRAEKASKNSINAFQGAKNILSRIEPGQPVLVGHHSEKRHRRDLAKSDSLMRKSVEEQRKADYYEQKAERLEQEGGPISSDDPEALDKLRDKLEALEKEQADMKIINTAHRAFAKKGLAALEDFALSDKVKLFIADWKPQYAFEKSPIQPYQFSNLNAKIKTVKARIEALEKMAAKEDKEVKIGEVTVRFANSENRLMLIFPNKPSEEMRTELKKCAFKWSPTQGAWMRKLTNDAVYAAKMILKPKQ